MYLSSTDKERWFRDAINKGRDIEFYYKGSPRKVKPQAVYFSNGFLYLEAYCYQAGELRVFRGDRITATREDWEGRGGRGGLK